MKMPESKRGIPLFFATGSQNCEIPVVTVENYCKWYDLYLVFPSGMVAIIEYDNLEEFVDTPYIDHTPNPLAVMCLAGENGFVVDKDAWQAMVDQWEEVNS